MSASSGRTLRRRGAGSGAAVSAEGAASITPVAAVSAGISDLDTALIVMARDVVADRDCGRTMLRRSARDNRLDRFVERNRGAFCALGRCLAYWDAACHPEEGGL